MFFAMLSLVMSLTSVVSISICPLVGCRRLKSKSSKVDFPDPVGPIMAVIFPAGIFGVLGPVLTLEIVQIPPSVPSFSVSEI